MVSHGKHCNGGGSKGGGGHSDGHVLVLLLVVVLFSWSFFNWVNVGKGNTGLPGPGGEGCSIYSIGFRSDVESSCSNGVQMAKEGRWTGEVLGLTALVFFIGN